MATPLFQPEPLVVTLTIVSISRDGQLIPPRTKKNHAQLITHMKHPVLLPSKAYTEWERGASAAMAPTIHAMRDALPITFPVNCKAVFYRDALRGDAVGFYQAVADFLQKDLARKGQAPLQVLADDKWIVSWDGSRLDKDAARPRIEVELTEIR